MKHLWFYNCLLLVVARNIWYYDLFLLISMLLLPLEEERLDTSVRMNLPVIKCVEQSF